MPSRLAANARSLKALAVEPYICPSCYIGRVSNQEYRRLDPTRLRQNARSASYDVRPQQGRGHLRLRKTRDTHLPLRHVTAKRHASNGALASVTAINAPTTVPAAYRDLHQKLLALQDSASGYVDLSRLKLAARSLESDNPVVRVALLGLGSNGAAAARKLARVLLGDALGEEEAWERELLQSSRDGRSLLLRYGDAEDTVQHSPLMQTMHVPSPFLKRHNLEILVSTLNADGRSAGLVSDTELEEAILVPSLTTPTSDGGRVGFVRYPVHKALVVAEGITGAVEYGRLPRFLDRAYLINVALSLPLRSSSGIRSAEQAATDNVVDTDLAAHALDLFRASRANSAQFSDEWQTSRISAVKDWIAGSKEAASGGMTLAVRKLLDSTLLNASSSIEKSESEQVSAIKSATVPDTKRADLDAQVSSWSQDAHRDLQLNLSTGLASRAWRRTAWWRLLWRIDDVSASAADILRMSFLTEAEQSLAFISGRVAEAGLATLEELKEAGASAVVLTNGVNAETTSAPEKHQTIDGTNVETQIQTTTPSSALNVGDLLQTPTLLTRVQQQTGVDAVFDPPWPQTIYLSRQLMLQTLVPSLHRKAQTLLLSTLSTVGGTTALGAWLFVATADMYSGGAIAALGLVWSLRRLQKLWGKEREDFAVMVQEDGRKVLAEVESHLRRIIKEGGRVSVRPEDAQGWREAREALEQCRGALEKIS